MTNFEQQQAAAIDEGIVVQGWIDFLNGEEPADFLRGLAGMERSPAAISRLTGQPILTGIDARRATLRADATAIVERKLSRTRRKEIASQADRVTVEVKGSQRRMRPAFLRFDDAQAVLGYVTHLIATREYGQRLTRCGLESCPKFFLREARRGAPAIYCSLDCAEEGKRAASRNRSQNDRNRKAAIRKLSKRYPSRARELVYAVAEPDLSVDELVKRATEAAAQKRRGVT